MRVNNQFISNEQAVPVVQSGLFQNTKNKRFATILFGEGCPPSGSDPLLFEGYLKLRKNVYVDQTGMLNQSEVLPSGFEIDSDDKRSIHIAVFENLGDDSVGVLGCLRLIIKRDTEVLPIEIFYPEVFVEAAPKNSTELSRFISRAEKGKGDNFKIIMSLFNAALSYANENDICKAYGVIEPELEESLKRFGFSFTRIAEPKMVEDYNDYNVGIEIDLSIIRKEFDKMNIIIESYKSNVPYFW